MVVSNIVNSVTGLMGFLLPMSGHEKQFRSLVCFFSPMIICLELIVIPIYGVLGAAIVASSMAIIFGGILTYKAYTLLNIRIFSFN